MYARVTTFQCDPSRLEELAAVIDEVRPRIKALPGVVDVYGMWRSDGHGVVTGIYRSERAALAAAPQVLEIWGGLAEFLAGLPRTEVYDYVEHVTA